MYHWAKNGTNLFKNVKHDSEQWNGSAFFLFAYSFKNFLNFYLLHCISVIDQIIKRSLKTG